MAKTRPFVLSVDLDGVVANYEQAFAASVGKQLGCNPEDIGPQTCWEFADCPNWPIESVDQFRTLHEEAVAERMFLTMHEIDGASDALWALNDELDVHIRVVTHRFVGHGNHQQVAADTVMWLDSLRPDGRHRVPYRDLCFLGDKAQLDTNLAVDDAPHNIEAIRREGLDAIVFDTHYNRHLPGPRAHNWTDIYNYVKGKITA